MKNDLRVKHVLSAWKSCSVCETCSLHEGRTLYIKHVLISSNSATKNEKMQYWIYKSAFGFTNQQFFNA